MCQWKTFILFIAMVSCVNRGGGNVNEQIRKHCKISKVNQAHQVGQDYFDRQEMPRGVEQDAPVREPGEVADGRSIDAFLHARNKSSFNELTQSKTNSNILRISYRAIVVLINQLAESFQA